MHNRIMYSLDYRQRVFEIKDSERLTYEETSKRFKVSMRTLFNWRREIKPKLKRNKPASKIDMEALKQHVCDYPDHYYHERANEFRVTTSTMFYALKRLGVSYIKNAEAPKNERSGAYAFPEEDIQV